MDRLNNVSIKEAQQIISEIINSGNTQLPVMLHGSPGLGKSAIIEYVASILGFQVVEVLLSTKESSDVLGVPYVDTSNKMQYSTPPWFPDGSKPCIIFLDEITNAQISTIHAAYGFVHNRTITNGKKLPDNALIICAGNSSSDKTGAKDLVPAMANRMIHLHIDKHRSVGDFLDYITDSLWNRTLVGFLTYKKDAVYTTYSNDPSFATARTWEKVNTLLSMEFSEYMLKIAIASAVGSAYAIDFMAYRELNDKLPNWELLRTTDDYVYTFDQKDQSMAFSLSTGIAFELIDSLVNNHSTHTRRLVKFLDTFSDEIKIITLKALKRNNKAVAKIGTSPELRAILAQVSKYIGK